MKTSIIYQKGSVSDKWKKRVTVSHLTQVHLERGAIKMVLVCVSVDSLSICLCSRWADSGVMSADEVLRSLKTELERCLKKCQDKSQQITKLQAELKTCKATLAENDVTLELAHKELQETKNKVTVSQSKNTRLTPASELQSISSGFLLWLKWSKFAVVWLIRYWNNIHSVKPAATRIVQKVRTLIEMRDGHDKFHWYCVAG